MLLLKTFFFSIKFICYFWNSKIQKNSLKGTKSRFYTYKYKKKHHSYSICCKLFTNIRVRIRNSIRLSISNSVVVNTVKDFEPRKRTICLGTRKRPYSDTFVPHTGLKPPLNWPSECSVTN